MESEEIKEIQKRLTRKMMLYIDGIIEMYGKFIPIETLKRLQQIKNYDGIILIRDGGTVNGYASADNIELPLSTERVLEFFRKIPGYGSNKTYKLCDEHNLMLNDYDFFDYIKHIFLTGMTLEGFFENLLLHETMHFCGGVGGWAFDEGLNEYLTRKIALEKGFKTSGYGYPKEVAIVYELQNIFGEDVILHLVFMPDLKQRLEYIRESLGEEAVDFFSQIYSEMIRESYDKYYRYMDTYDGIFGVFKKARNYKKINYEKVYQLINSYKKNKRFKG